MALTIQQVLSNLKNLLDKFYIRSDGSNLKDSANTTVKNGLVCTDNTGKIIPKTTITTNNIASDSLTSYIQGTSINGNQLTSSSITGDKIADNTLTNEKYTPTQITENSTLGLDLDNYRTHGVYFCSSNDTVGKMSHTPWQITPPSNGTGTGSAFSLIVLKTTGSYVRQILFNYQNNTIDTYTRNYSGSWTPTTTGSNGWIKLSIDGHTHNYIPNTTGSVTTNHILNGTIKNEDIENTTIDYDKIKNGAITTDKLASDSVTTDKIKNSTIKGEDIANTTITGGKLVNKTITDTQLNDDSVTTDKIKSSNVTLAKLNSDVYDTTIGGTENSSKLITSNAVRKHTHGNVSNDGKINNDVYVYNNVEGESYNKLVVTDNNNKLRTSTEVGDSYVIHEGTLNKLTPTVDHPTLKEVLSAIDNKIGNLEKPRIFKWYTYSNDSFTFNSTNWTGSISIAYNPEISYARIYFNLTKTPLTKDNTTATLVNLGSNNVDTAPTLISNALRPKVQETGVVHSQGDVFGVIKTNGDIDLVNNSGGKVSDVHGILLYRYKDEYHKIRNDYINGTLEDI